MALSATPVTAMVIGNKLAPLGSFLGLPAIGTIVSIRNRGSWSDTPSDMTQIDRMVSPQRSHADHMGVHYPPEMALGRPKSQNSNRNRRA